MTGAAVWKCLDASTSHISRVEMDSIEACPVRTARHEHGAILFLADEEIDSEWERHPNLLRLAKNANAKSVSVVPPGHIPGAR